jgi:hypothetical protein
LCYLALNILRNPQITAGIEIFALTLLILLFTFMILLCIYIEFCFQTINYVSKDTLSQYDTSFKYIWVFGRILICIITIFFNIPGTLGTLKDICVIIVAFFMILLHYHLMPLKHFQVQLISGGLLLWYFERTIL